MSLDQHTIETYVQRLRDIDRQRIFGRLVEYIRWTVLGACQGRKEPAGRTS